MILDLHIHSKYSFDSIISPKKIIKTARQRGLNGIAVTDHNTIRGGLEASQINQDPNFLVIVGAEITTEAGDIVGLFLKEEIEERQSNRVIDHIHRQGGLVVLPHPYKGHKLNDELLEKVDLIEGFNARTSEEKNDRSIKLAQEWNKPVVAGSDAHFAAEIGMARTMVEISNSRDIQSALVNGQAEYSGSESPYYWLILSQIIKVIKTRQFARVPVRLASVLGRRLKTKRYRQ